MENKNQIVLLGSTSFLSQMMISMVNLAFVYYLKDKFHLSSYLIASSISIFSICYCVACIMFGKISKQFRPRNLIMFSLIGMGVSVFLVTIFDKLYLINLSFVFYGLFMSFLWPQIESWLSRGKEKKNLNKVMSIFNLSWSIGTAFAPLLCGILVEKSSALPIYFTSVVFFVVAILLFVITNRNPELRSFESEKKYIEISKMKDNSTPLRYLCWIGVIIGYIVLGAISNIFPLYARDVLGLRETSIGVLLWLRGGISCFVFFLIGKLSFWHFKKSYIFISQLLIGLLCFISRDFSSFIALSVFFISFGFVFPFLYMQSMFHGASGAVNRTERMIIHEVLLTGGYILGSVLGGFLLDYFSYSNMMTYFAILILVSVAIEYIISLIGFRNVKKIKNA